MCSQVTDTGGATPSTDILPNELVYRRSGHPAGRLLLRRLRSCAAILVGPRSFHGASAVDAVNCSPTAQYGPEQAGVISLSPPCSMAC